MLWETLTGKRLFQGDSEAEAMRKVLDGRVQPPSALAPDVAPVLDAIVLRGLDLDPSKRFQTAGEMALAIEDAVPLVAASRVGRWVREAAAQRLAMRTERIAAMESNSAIRGPSLDARRSSVPDATPPPTSGSVVGPPPGAPVTSFAPPPAAITLPLGTRRPTAPRPSAWLAASLFALVLLAIAGLAAFAIMQRRSRARPPEIAAQASAAREPAPAPIPVETAPPSPVETPSLASPAPSASGAASAPAPIPTVPLTALPTVARPTGAPPPRAVQPRATATGTARPAADCNPPFYFNAKGDRIFKQECL